MAGEGNNKSSDDEGSSSKGLDHVDEGAVKEEYEFLDSKLDELSCALDFLEQKNDDIHQKLKELLRSNKEIRKELQNGNCEDEDKS